MGRDVTKERERQQLHKCPGWDFRPSLGSCKNTRVPSESMQSCNVHAMLYMHRPTTCAIVYAIIRVIRICTGWESHCMWLCMVCHVKYVQTTTTSTCAIVIRMICMIRICNHYWSCICAIVYATQCHVKYAQTTATCAIVCNHTGVPGIACDDCDNDVDDNYDNDDDVMTTT